MLLDLSDDIRLATREYGDYLRGRAMVSKGSHGNKEDNYKKKRKEIQAKEMELKVDEVEHVDFIGEDKYNFHPNHHLGSFFNELWRIELKHGLKFEEFRLSKKAKQ
ncbi:hypothetical protein LguiA_012840 [Lonicera macranthoides]